MATGCNEFLHIYYAYVNQYLDNIGTVEYYSSLQFASIDVVACFTIPIFLCLKFVVLFLAFYLFPIVVL